MSAFLKLIVAGAAIAFLSAPAVATDRATKIETAHATAQQDCRGWGVSCELQTMPEYCIAEDRCAVALPGSAIARYDALMDAAAGR